MRSDIIYDILINIKYKKLCLIAKKIIITEQRNKKKSFIDNNLITNRLKVFYLIIKLYKIIFKNNFFFQFIL